MKYYSNIFILIIHTISLYYLFWCMVTNRKLIFSKNVCWVESKSHLYQSNRIIFRWEEVKVKLLFCLTYFPSFSLTAKVQQGRINEVMFVVAKHLRAPWVILTERIVLIIFIDDHKLVIQREPELATLVLNFKYKNILLWNILVGSANIYFQFHGNNQIVTGHINAVEKSD